MAARWSAEDLAGHVERARLGKTRLRAGYDNEEDVDRLLDTVHQFFREQPVR